jgi:hypothetical protein
LSSSWAQSWTNASDMNQAGDMADNTGGAFFGPSFASGTDYAPGGLALVGEHGPEILTFRKARKSFRMTCFGMVGAGARPFTQEPASLFRAAQTKRRWL